MLESLLVCLSHCQQELLRANNSSPSHHLHHYQLHRRHSNHRTLPSSALYLQLFQHHILARTLRYFNEDLGVEGYIPSLPSMSSGFPSYTDLNSRFLSACVSAVDLALHCCETPFTAEHAQWLAKQPTVPSVVTYQKSTTRAASEMAFVWFLVQYFHLVLLPLVRKVKKLALDAHCSNWLADSVLCVCVCVCVCV